MGIKSPETIRAEARATLRKAHEELQKLKTTPLLLAARAKADPLGMLRDVFSIVEGITSAVFTLAEEPNPRRKMIVYSNEGHDYTTHDVALKEVDRG